MTAAATLAAPSKTDALTMQAAVYRQYGGPEVVSLEHLERPAPRAHEVLVKVHAAGVTMGDLHVVNGKPYLIRVTPYGGLPGPRNKTPGQTMAGTVAAVGSKVTTCRVGDEVFGQGDRGAFAEYMVLAADLLLPKPTNLTFEEAAAVPWAATALLGWRVAGLKPGQRVLVNGASGGVGTWAVQLAKVMGAQVTAVCSTRNVELVRSLGADQVIDYSKEDFVQGGARFDVMFDLVGNRSLKECRSVLNDGGTYLPCSEGASEWFGPMLKILGGMFSWMFTKQRIKQFVMTPNLEQLQYLKEVVEAGKARPVLSRSYSFAELPQALGRIAEGHSQGQIVVRVAS
jgi:NADPH:quinone reductase-like Zn-dependent oxidoreductase